MVKRLFLAGLMTISVVAVTAIPTQAQIDIAAAPSLLELEAAPGATGTQEITISNGGGAAFAATSEVTPYRNAAADDSAETWLSVAPAAFEVPAGEQAVLTLDIVVPDDAPSGGHFAFVTVTTGDETVAEAGQNVASVAGQLIIGVLITVDAEGPLTHEAEIEQFAPLLTADGRVEFVAMVRNQGNVHFSASGGADILTEDGEELAAVEFPATVPILPEVERQLASTGSLPLPAGESYTAEATVEYEGDDPATASVTFDPGDVALTIGDTSLCENLDTGPSVTLTVANEGSMALRPFFGLTVLAENGDPVGAPVGIEPALFWPGAEETTTFELPQQYPSGSYTLMIEGQYGAEPITAEVPFQIGGLDGEPIPLCGS